MILVVGATGQPLLVFVVLSLIFPNELMTTNIGGIGRVMSMLSMGNPSTPFILFTLLELLFPLLILWQNKLLSGAPPGHVAENGPD